MSAERDRYLDTSKVASLRTVEFSPSQQLTSGSTKKANTALRLMRSIFRQKLDCVVQDTASGVSIACPRATEAEILSLCAVVEERLGLLQQQPLSAKTVEQILSISGAERRRWSKDGRLPSAGQSFFSQGKKQVSLPIYAPEVIRSLAARPDQVAAWRRADAGTEPRPLHSESFQGR
ncbi:hypothetical protein LQG66_25735 [Bradyrhizobium ontarionense]|uniref:Uncharacterized protein n=1 Tax=Bradyrhizobium ontarionense TaxID=2898149 RepID=A0ABY3R7B6_9BRAD|nr:hypothetical protein [Bradyrhizobium sp. A19]UFZ02658.1 hypothetical protein LQG66_25735 [Bradyrhizobium sp. A19]